MITSVKSSKWVSLQSDHCYKINILRNELTDTQREILNKTWNYFNDRNNWIPTRVLHLTPNKQTIITEIEKLSGSIIFENNSNCYELTIIGVLLTEKGLNYEDILVRYIEYIKNRYLSDPEVDIITSKEVETDLYFDSKHLSVLCKLISLCGLWGRCASIGQEWSFGVPSDIDDFPQVKDNRSYLHEILYRKYDPKMPYKSNDILGYLRRKATDTNMSAKEQLIEKSSNKVFVIHGRNEKLRRSMFEFLRSIGLHPLEWIEAIKLTKKPSPYVKEVLDAAFEYAQAIIFLMTPDDEARLLPEFWSPDEKEYEKKSYSSS